MQQVSYDSLESIWLAKRNISVVYPAISGYTVYEIQRAIDMLSYELGYSILSGTRELYYIQDRLNPFEYVRFITLEENLKDTSSENLPQDYSLRASRFYLSDFTLTRMNMDNAPIAMVGITTSFSLVVDNDALHPFDFYLPFVEKMIEYNKSLSCLMRGAYGRVLDEFIKYNRLNTFS